MMILKNLTTHLQDIPVCVRCLLVVNTVLFALLAVHGGVVLGAKVLFAIPGGLLVQAGGFYRPLVSGEWEVWRIVSYAFLHGNLMHLAFNMIALWQVGSPLEREIGWSRFLGVYFFSTVIAIAFSAVATPDTITIGASGALFGLIGFAISFYHRVGGQKGLARRNLMIQWAVYAIMFGFIMGADNGAHIGGVIAGCVAGLTTPASREGLDRRSVLFPGQNQAVLGAFAVCLSIQLFSWARTAYIFFTS